MLTNFLVAWATGEFSGSVAGKLWPDMFGGCCFAPFSIPAVTSYVAALPLLEKKNEKGVIELEWPDLWW